MTSHLIETLAKRAENHDTSSAFMPINADCAFCRIIHQQEPAFKVYENDHVLAILDILPIRQGHVLVIPKQHIARLSELPEALAAELGKSVSKVANALTKALDNTGLNVVCNQEYAQAVPHVHYHIVPAPILYGHRPSAVLYKTSPRPEEASAALQADKDYASMLRAEFHAREELDDEEAQQLVELIKAKL